MLTLEALRDELAKITYKPGWRFVLYPHRWEGIWLSILAELPDADWPTRTTVINVRAAVPPIPHATYFHTWLAYRIGRVGTSRDARVPARRWREARRPARARRQRVANH